MTCEHWERAGLVEHISSTCDTPFREGSKEVRAQRAWMEGRGRGSGRAGDGLGIAPYSISMVNFRRRKKGLNFKECKNKYTVRYTYHFVPVSCGRALSFTVHMDLWKKYVELVYMY